MRHVNPNRKSKTHAYPGTLPNDCRQADRRSLRRTLALIAAGGDRYVVSEGPAEGMRGFFTRDANGKIVSVHVGGRTATRV